MCTTAPPRASLCGPAPACSTENEPRLPQIPRSSPSRREEARKRNEPLPHPLVVSQMINPCVYLVFLEPGLLAPISKCLQRLMGSCILYLHSLHSILRVIFLVVLAFFLKTGLV